MNTANLARHCTHLHERPDKKQRALACAGGVTAASQPRKRRNNQLQSPRVPVRILVVDDEPNILGAMEPLLRSHGYEVLTAMSGRGAIAAAAREQPDLIVLDLGLPDMDGVEVCRTVRDDGGPPIIVLSARGAEARQGAGARCGSRRLRDEAVRRGGTAGAHPRGAAASGSRGAGERSGDARRSGDRSRSQSRHPRRRGDQADAEGARAAALPRAASRPRAHASRDSEGGVGTARRRSARAPARARGVAPQEDRTRSVAAALHLYRALGRLPLRGRRGELAELPAGRITVWRTMSA